MMRLIRSKAFWGGVWSVFGRSDVGAFFAGTDLVIAAQSLSDGHLAWAVLYIGLFGVSLFIWRFGE